MCIVGRQNFSDFKSKLKIVFVLFFRLLGNSFGSFIFESIRGESFAEIRKLIYKFMLGYYV